MAGKKTTSKHHERKFKGRIDRNYLHALKSYWEGRSRTAIERVSQAIVEATEVSFCFPMYRLWIEVLTAGQDHAALAGLSDHLLFLSNSEPEHATTFMALKGLAHYELDEIDAASVIARSVRKATDNHYCLELRQLVDDRTSLRFKKSLLQACEHELTDYFHLEALAKSLVLRNRNSEYHELARRIRDLFPDTPLVDAIDLMSYLTKGDYQRALEAAGQLTAHFPGNLEHSIHFAYIATRAGDHELAIAELYRAANLHSEPDADLYSLLGYALSERAMAQNDKTSAYKAVESLEKAISIYQELGVPISFPQGHLDRMVAIFKIGGERDVDSSPRHNWLIKLSEGKFHELKTAPEEAIRNLRRAMGSAPKPGDVCYFVGDDYRNVTAAKNEQHWRLGAVYEVISEPIWHPIEQYQTRLRLLVRPEVSIPIPIHEFDRTNTAPRRRDPDNSMHFGVLALNDTALRDIESAITDFSSVYSDLKQVLR